MNDESGTRGSDHEMCSLTDKQYYETQNYFEPQPTPDPSSRGSRVHTTPGYPVDATVGITLHLGRKPR